MRKLLTAAASVFAAFGLTAAAQAAVIDFAGAADSPPGERGLADTAAGVPNLTIDGVAMRLTTPADEDWFPYLDSSGSEGPAGLGVCKTVDGASQCVPSSDDNVTIGEDVKIEFLDGAGGPLFFDIRQLSFRGEGHVDFNGNAVNTLLINGAEWTFAAAFMAAATGIFGGTSITFAFGGSSPEQFYVNLISDVPLPGALTLMLSGLAGLAFASRRKRTV